MPRNAHRYAIFLLITFVVWPIFQTRNWTVAADGPLANAKVSLPLQIGAEQIVYDRKRDLIYATCGTGAPAPYKNCLVTISPNTFQVIDSIPVGTNPRSLAISENGRRLYIGIFDDYSFRFLDLATRELGPPTQLSLNGGEAALPVCLTVAPDSAMKVMVASEALYTSAEERIEVFGAGGRLSEAGTGLGPQFMTFINPTTLIGIRPNLSVFKYHYDGQSLTLLDKYDSDFPGWTFQHCRGLIYTSVGKIIDPITMEVVGQLPGMFYFGSRIVTSEAENTALVMSLEVLRLHDLDTQEILDEIDLYQQIGEFCVELIYAGENHLALRTINGTVRLITDIPLAKLAPKTLALNGTIGDDTIEFAPTPGLLSINGVVQDVSGFERVKIDCRRGNDRVFCTDLAGAQDLTYLSKQRIQLENSAIHFEAIACEETNFNGSDFSDVAALFDTEGNDNIIARPGMTRMMTNSGLMVAENTASTFIYASAGYDSTTVTGSPAADMLNGSLKTGNFRLFASDYSITLARPDFLTVNATGGSDIASLVDSDGNDYFIANGNFTRFTNSLYDVRTRNFEFLTAHATNSGRDRADLVRGANGTVSQSGGDNILSGPGYRYNARNFEDVRIRDN